MKNGGNKKMKERQNKKITFICFLIASICFYISAAIGIISKAGSNAVTNLCLGSTFLCLSTAYLNKDKDEDKDGDKNKLL